MRSPFAISLLCLLLIVAGAARASWTIEYGVRIEENESTTEIQTNISVGTTATFEGDSFVIDSFGWEFDAPTTWQWNLTTWNPPFNVTFEGNVTTNGSATFVGFQGYYLVSGLYGYPSFSVSGPSFSFNILPGAQTFSITPVSLQTSGLGLSIDSRFNSPQTTLSSVVTLLDNVGNPISGATINHTVLRPDGSMLSGLSMTSTSIAGVYTANVTFGANEPDGAYTTVARYGGTVAAQTVIKESLTSELTTMATFFASPFMQLLPYLVGLVGGVFIVPRTRGFLQAMLLAMGCLLAVFAVTLSRTNLDAIAPYLSPILIISYVSIAFYGVFHTLKEATNPSPA